MKQSENPALSNEVTLWSDISPARIASIFLIFFGLILGLLPQIAQNRDEVGIPVLAALFLVGMAIAYGGIVIGRAAKRTNIIFKRATNSITIERHGWFGAKMESESLSAGDVLELHIDQSSDSDGDSTYKLLLKTRLGKTVQLAGSSYSREYLVERREQLEDALFQGGSKLADIHRKRQQQKQVPVAVWLVLAFVMGLPLMAEVAGELTDFPKVVVKAGRPDQSTMAQAKTLFAAVLHKDEQITWVGQPEVGRESWLKQWFVIPFAIVWTLFSLVWTGLVLAAALEKKDIMAYAMVLFGLPFVYIGFGLLSLPYFSRQHDLTTVYALTTEGALRTIDGKPCRLVDYHNRNFGPIEVTRYKPERADILFITDRAEHSKHPYGGFYGVEDANTATEILRQHSL